MRATHAINIYKLINLFSKLILYVNHIANAVPDQTIKLFADDTNLFTASKSKIHVYLTRLLMMLLTNLTYTVFLPHRSDSIMYILMLNLMKLP